MTEKRFKEIGRHIKDMGYDRHIKYGNYTTIFTTEYGDVLITDYDIKFPNNPNSYYANKKSIDDTVCFVVQHYAQLSWPSTIPHLPEHSESISDLASKCKQYRDRLKMARGDIRHLPIQEKEKLQSSIMQCIMEELRNYAEKFNFKYNGVDFSSRLKGGCDTDNHITFHKSLFLEDATCIRYEILAMLCSTQYKKYNIVFWRLLDHCSFQAGITYATDFIVPELFRTPKNSNRYIKMPIIGDFSQKHCKTEFTYYNSEQNRTKKILL